MTEPELQSSPLLPHHAHLLRECASAPGPRLLDHRVRRHRAAQARARHRHLVPHRHRRARAEDRALRQAGRPARRRISPTKSPASFAALWDRLGLTYDDFIRTTEPRHKRGVQKLFATLRDRGFIYKGSYTGQYCVSDEAWVDVPPGAPCPDCGRITETVSEENYFFKLSAFERKLLEFYEANPGFMQPESTRARSHLVRARRAQGSFRQPHQRSLGHSCSRRRKARHLRLARRAGQLHHRPRLWLG